MAYNVHGLGSKYLHHDFFQYLEQFDIFILLETHVEAKNQVNYENRFKNYKTYWKSAARNNIHGRAIGGQVCGVRKDLDHSGIKHYIVQRRDYDVLVCTMSSMKFEIIPVYIRGVNWMADFERLKEIVESNDGKKIIIGDHNIRIGEEQQLPEELLHEFPVCRNRRKSSDKTTNLFGRRYTDFCNNNGLVILNGRTTGDEEGRFTFTNKNGSSVNDICSASLDMLGCVQKFEVDNQLWSDHFPITLRLGAEDVSQDKAERLNLLPKLLWKNERKLNYQKTLNNNLISLQRETSHLSLTDFTSLILKSYPNTMTRRNRIQFKNKWFDRECWESREETMNQLNIFRTSHATINRENYAAQRIEYQNLCKRKRNEYYTDLERRLDTISDSKSWWTMAKEIRQQETVIGCTINADILGDYFRTLLNPNIRSSVIYYAPNNTSDHLLDRDFTLLEIKEQLAKVKENKAPGEDRVPYEFFINATDEYLKELCNVFTRIFNGFDDYNMFRKSVIFPIHKKGDVNQACNYRGISFMNCIGKLMMGMINSRVTEWTSRFRILNEYQAGFRKGYSTVDNVYNLCAIINMKWTEKKKVYAFFVDFKAAFDRIPRALLIYKLHQMGLSWKTVEFIERVYINTTSAVWTGNELSNYFETGTGVKQGCLLSPILFALYLNDLHDTLDGGLVIDEINIRLLMYADDIVIIADDPKTLQNMISNLELYCDNWGMEVNQTKSEIMVFRKGGRVAASEQWMYKGEYLRIVSEYKYLGITLTPKLSFAQHILNKNDAAKICINATWKNFIGKPNISLKGKWKMFLSVCRSIQSYGAQIWGNAYFEDVDKLYRYFIKRVLKLPENTPNYVLALETGYEQGYIYTYALHLKYMAKTIFDLEHHRLPHKLSVKIMEKNISWYKDFTAQLTSFNIEHTNIKGNKSVWYGACRRLIEKITENSFNENIQRSQASQHRIYRHLDHRLGSTYCNDSFTQIQISFIMKARGGLIWLNGNVHRAESAQICSMCNLREVETTQHFIGRCPVFNRIRIRYFGRMTLSEREVIYVLNGGGDNCWLGLYKYLREAMNYRTILINEFNY